MLLRRYHESLEQRRRERRRERCVIFFNAFALGALLSAVFSLLFAPKAGKELRKDIAVKTTDGVKVVKLGAVERFNKASTFTEDVYGKAKNVVVSKFSKKPESVSEEAEDDVE